MTLSNTIRDYVANHFEEALQSGCITVCYEPILRALTGKICAFEALARWHDPEQGEIRPCDFIPVLEQENTIHLLDYFVTKATIEELHARRQQGLPIVPIVINLSRRDFLLSDPIGVLNHLTEKYDLPHIYLQVEITETAFVRDEETIVHAIQRLRENGYAVTLDNFGEGHSSLAALQRCSIDEISLHKIFFEDFTENTRLLLTSILLMAKTLGIHTAAEGVQTEEQASFLRSIGCEKLQGPVCRTRAATVYHLQDLQAQVTHLESLLEQQVLYQAGLVNLVTDAPVALFTDDAKNLQILTANASYQKQLQQWGSCDLQDVNDHLRVMPQFIATKVRSIADATIKSHKAETGLFVYNGQYIQFSLHNLAGTNGFYIHKAEFQYLPQEKTMLGTEYDLIVRHLMQFYHDIYLINNRRNRIEIITSGISPLKAGSQIHGIMTAFMNFAANHIHRDDHKRFLHYIHRLANPEKGQLFATTQIDLFRVRMPSGGYHWKTFSITAFRHEGRPCQLLCLRDFVFEELPERDKLINTVLASYGFTNLPENQASQITNDALWRTLTQFSHRKLFWKDKQARFCGASPAFLRYYGIQNTNELIGKTDKDLGWHLSNLEMDQTEKCVLEHGEPVHDGQGRCIARGRQHAISFSKYPIYQGTEIVGLLGEFRDVEEERNYHKLQRKLYLIDEETDFYNYRGMILASVEFADNLRLKQIEYVGAMFVVPELDSLEKLYGSSIHHAALQHICKIIRRNTPASVVGAHTGSGVFVLFLKGRTVGAMRRFIEQIKAELAAVTEIEGFACHFSMHYALESGTEARTSDEFLKILSSRCLDYLPSFGVTGTIGDQISFDLEKFNDINRLIYIADPETYDLVYVNPCLLRYLHLPADYKYAGQKCFRLAGLSEPCTNCPKNKLRRDRFLFRQYHSPNTSRDYQVWNTQISWNNRNYLFSDAIDVKHVMATQENNRMDERANISVNDITSLAIQEEDPSLGLMRMMEKLGLALDATHILVMEEEPDGFHLSCTYEWHDSGAAPLQSRLAHVPIFEAQPFYDAFRQSPVLIVEDAAAYHERHPELRLFHTDRFERYAIGQLKLSHRSFGYLSILNPDKSQLSILPNLLPTILRVSTILMRNRDNIRKLHEISTVDQLTGVGNRRALTDFVDKCLRPGTMYAVIFIDVNELKKMNDTFGHARGDLLIQAIAYVLSNVAGKNHVFRLGGDEFLVLMPCSNDEEAITIIDHMEQSMATHRCSAAIGYVLCLAPFHDLDGLIHQADEKMYSDKKRKHMRRDDD